MRSHTIPILCASVFAFSGCATVSGLPVVGGLFDSAAAMGDKALNKPAVFSEFEKPAFCSDIGQADIEAAFKKGVYSDRTLADMQQVYVGGMAEDPKKARAQVQRFPKDREYLEKVFIEKYGAKVCSDRDNYLTENIAKPGELEQQWRKSSEVMVKFKESLASAAAEAPAAHAAALKKAEGTLSEYAEADQLRDKNNRHHLSDNRSEVNAALDTARRQQEIALAASGAESSDVVAMQAAYQSTTENLESALAQLSERLVSEKAAQREAEAAERAAANAEAEMKRLAETEAPKMIYEGKDRKKLLTKVKKHWKKKYPKDKLLKVWITTESWDRKTGTRWNKQSSEYYDESWLQAAVAVKDKEDKRLANVYVFTLAKDHRDKNKLKMQGVDKDGARDRLLVRNVN